MDESSVDPERFHAKEDTRIVIVGKTGNGKSTLANILLQKPDVRAPKTKQATPIQTKDQATPVNNDDQGFTVGGGFQSTTTKCGYKESSTAWGRHMKLVDTQGLYDTATEIGQVLLELSKVTSLSSPGPHAILFVISCGVKFTDEEYDSFNVILKMFTDKVKRFLVVVFSKGDLLDDTIEDLIASAPGTLKKVMEIVGDNYVVISKTDDTEKREREVRHLLEKIDRVSKNGEVFYKNDDLQKQTEAMNEEIKVVMKERNVDGKEAEFLVKKGLAMEEERFQGLQKKLIIISVSSAAFIVLAGITGGVAAVALAAATVNEAATGASVATFVSLLGTKLAEAAVYHKIKAKFQGKDKDKNTKEGTDKCAIM